MQNAETDGFDPRRLMAKAFSQRWMLVTLMSMGLQAAHAATELWDVQVSGSQHAEPRQSNVDIFFTEVVPPMRSFSLDSGRRLVFDFHDVKSGLGRQTMKLENDLISQVLVASNSKGTRVVLQQRAPASFELEQADKHVRVVVSPMDELGKALSPEQEAAAEFAKPSFKPQLRQTPQPRSKHSAVVCEAASNPKTCPQPVSTQTAVAGSQAVPKVKTQSVLVEAESRADTARDSVGVERDSQHNVRAVSAEDTASKATVQTLDDAKALIAVARAQLVTAIDQPVSVMASSEESRLDEPRLKPAQAQGHALTMPMAPKLKPVTSSPQRNAPAVVTPAAAEPLPRAEQSPVPVALRPFGAKASPLPRDVAKAEPRISLNFQSIEIRSLLQRIADFSGFNVVASDGVSGEVTVQLKDVAWRDALQVILDAKGLGMREREHVIWVAPKADLLAYQENEIKSREASQELEALHSASFRLNYAKAAQVLAQISASSGNAKSPSSSRDKAGSPQPLPPISKTGEGRLMTARGVGFTDARTNQLFVTDTQASIDAVRAFVHAVDVPLRQVVIEAKIVEADKTFSRNLGVRLGVGNAGPVTLGSGIHLGPNYGSVSEGGATSVLPFVNLPATGLNGYDAASFAVSLFGPGASRFLNLEVSAMEADGRGKIVSSPRIVTADQVKATIEQGTEYPYQSATSSGATAVEFRKANLKLEVSPQITPSGHIILDVDISKDSRGETTAAGIAINTKHVQTQVLVENGGTLMIGGILEEYERNDVNKVPGVGDLPVVGNVFKSTRRQSDSAEVVVFLTPRVIEQQFAGNERDRSGRYARFGQVNGCPDAGQASGSASCGQ